MDKYLEDKEDNQWDGDFIFDTPALVNAQRKRGGSSGTSLTAHLSAANPIAKEKRKSAASAWSNAFKKLEAGPRQANTHTKTAVTSSFQAVKSNQTSATSTTTTVVHTQGAASLQSNAEFAYFDSEDQVGFQKPTRSYYSAEVDEPSVHTALEGSGQLQSGHVSRQPSRDETVSAFDDGIGEANLGFDDDDYIPNVGFDEDEVYLPGVPRPAQLTAPPPVLRHLSSANASTISSWHNSSTRSSAHSSESMHSGVGGSGSRVGGTNNSGVAGGDSGSLRYSEEGSRSPKEPPVATGLPTHQQHPQYMLQLGQTSKQPTQQQIHHHRSQSTSSGSGHGPRQPRPVFLHSRDTSTSSIQMQQQAYQQQIEHQRALEVMIESDEPLAFDVFESSVASSSGAGVGSSSNASLAASAAAAGRWYSYAPHLVRSEGSHDAESRQGAETSNPSSHHRRQQAHLLNSDQGPMLVSRRGASAESLPVSPSVRDRVRLFERREYLNRQGSTKSDDYAARPLPARPSYASSAASGGSAPGSAPASPQRPTVSLAHFPQFAQNGRIILDADEGSIHSPSNGSRPSSGGLRSRSRSRSHSTVGSGSQTASARSKSRSGSGSRSRSRSGSLHSPHSCSNRGSPDHLGFEYFSGSEGSNSDVFTEGTQESADWDADLEPSSAAAKQATVQTFKDIITGRAGGRAGTTAGVDGAVGDDDDDGEEKESLLDYLKRTVQKTLFPPNRTESKQPSPENRDLFACRSMDSADGDVPVAPTGSELEDPAVPPRPTTSISTPSLLSRDVNLETYEEEGHTLETANPHLKGLLDWVEATTQSVNSVLTSANSSKTHNARTLLHTEVDLPQGDLSFMEMLLERAEQLPASCSGQCIATLEIVCKWLRALCNLHDGLIGSLNYTAPAEEASAQDLRSRSYDSSIAKFRRTSSLGETRLICATFTTSAQSPNKNDELFFGELSGRRIDSVYDSCDEILQELLVSTTAALGANYRKLLSISGRPSNLQPANHESAGAAPRTWLTQMGMIPVKEAVNPPSTAPQAPPLRSNTAPSDDGSLVAETVRLSSQLMALYRLQINMLEVRVHMYDSYELVGCLQLLDKLAEELDKVTDTLFAALKRVLPPREMASAEQAAQRDHLDGLTAVAKDLLGCCFAIKVFSVCGVSPINFQQLPEHCQRISQTVQDAVRLSQDALGSASGDSGYYGMEHSDSNSRCDPASQKGAATPTYNVIHELTLGTHFLELMLTLPSPSVVRSKMYLAVYAYLSRLKKKQLPWQGHKYKLVSLKQPLDSFASVFNLYQGADAFGLNYSDLDNNSFTLTLAEVEGSIVQSFGEVFGALDQARILQLLLYESAVELLPTAPHDTSSGPAAFRQPKSRAQPQPAYQQRPHAQLKSSHYAGRRGSGAYPDTMESEAPSEPSQPGADKIWTVFTSMRGAFRHFSPALNLDKPLELDRQAFDDSPAESPVAPNQSAARPLSSNSSVAQHIQDNKRLLDTAPTRPKPRLALSYSCRYELFRFAHHVLYRLAQTITEMSPNVALDLYQVCIVALGHLRRLDEKSRIEKIAVMLAVKVGRRDAAIWHGEAVLRSLQRRNDNINEMLYLTDLLAAQYSENAQYELAAKALFSAISALNDHNKRESGALSPQSYLTTASSHRGSEKGTALVLAGAVTSVTEFERTLDPLLLKLGKLLLQFGCADRAADTFQVLLSSLCERTDCLANDAKKVTVLSWLAEAYLALEQYDTCAAVLKTIKAVRALKLHKAVSAAIGPRTAGRRRKLDRKSGARGGGGRGGGPTSALTRSLSALTNTPGALMSRSISDRRLMSLSRDFGEETPRLSDAGNMRSIDLRGGIAVPSSDSFDLDGLGETGGKRQSVLFSASVEKGAESTPHHQAQPTRSLSRQASSQLGSRPLPPTPKSNLAPHTPGGGEAAVLRNRPLPPTPLDLSALRGQDAHRNHGLHSARDTPRNDTLQETQRDSPRATPRETPRCSLNAAQLALTEGGSSSQKSAAAPSAVLQRANSKRQRKAQLLKNLQPLELSNNNLLMSEATTPAGRAGTDTQTCSSPFGALSTESNISPSLPATPAQGRPQSAINSIYTHYVRNPPEANLPQFCPTIEDLDLGHLKARLLFKGKKFASALSTLHTTLMAVEIGLVGRLEAAASGDGGNGTSMYGAGGGAVPALSRQALMELGELYCLRGRIQLEAAKSCADISFPFQVGSVDLFDKVASMLPVMPGAAPRTGGVFTNTGATAAATTSKATKPPAVSKVPETRRFAKGSVRRPRVAEVDLPSVVAARSSLAHSTAATAAHREKGAGDAAKGGLSSVLTITTREPRTYGSSADLCWDAMKWFSKARDLAKLAGDEIGGALVANSLAMCHLQPLFVPSALMKVPLDKAADLSGTDHQPLDSKGRQKPRKASLREVQNLMKWALGVHSQSCLPLPLMDTYLNLAEMCHLMGNAPDAVALWCEAKELFLLLFADGALLPLVRRGSAKFVRRMQSFVDRLVRFMFVLDKPTFNSCLHLLDTQVLLGCEVERMARRNKCKAEAVSAWLPDVLRRLVSGECSSKEASMSYPSRFSASRKSNKRKTVSRLSRFFSRLFRSTSDAPPPVEPPPASAAAATPTSVATSRATEPSVSGGSAVRFSGNLGKATDSFDSFIERSGFSAQLDMRRFYNMMNADLVAEKVLDFGWSDLVDYEALLRDCDGGAATVSNPEPPQRHFSNSSQSTTYARYAAVAANGGAPAPSLEALLQLNVKSKVDCAVKYRRLAAAAYLHEHVLRRAQLVEGGDADQDNWRPNLASLAVAADGLHPTLSAEAAEVVGLFRTTSMYGLSNSTPRLDRSPRAQGQAQTLSGQMGLLTPRKAALLNKARTSVASQGGVTYDLPIDPFADFDWMGESFADYTPHGRSLQVRAILDRMHGLSTGSSSNPLGSGRKHRRPAMGSDAAQFNALFMPEFDEAHQFTSEEVQHQCAARPPHHHRDTTGSSGLDTVMDTEMPRRPLPGQFNAEYLRSVDERAETVLIQRAWRCLLLLQNALRSYRSAERSMGHVRHEVRCGLCNLSLTMVRLRAFSRQYQGSLVDFERLQEDLPRLPAATGTVPEDPRPIEIVRASLETELLMLHNTSAPTERIREVRRALRECRSRQAVMLSQRLPYVVFAIHVEDNLMLYRPQDGTRVVQKLGGQGLTLARSGPGDTGSRETTPRDGPVYPRSAPPTPPPTATAPAMGIAQVERRSSPAHAPRTEPRVLEPKVSLISMLSLFSGSDVTRDSTRITPSSAAGSSSAGNQIEVGRTGSSSKFRAFGMSRKDSGVAKPALRKKSYFFSSSYTLDEGAGSISEAADSAEAPERVDSGEGSEPFAGLSKSLSGPRTSGAILAQTSSTERHRGGQQGPSGSSASHSTSESAVFPSEAAAAMALPSRPALRMRDTRFLYDLAVAASDLECGGGREGRRMHWSELRNDSSVLSAAMMFLRGVANSMRHPAMADSATGASKEVGAVQAINAFAGSTITTLSMNTSISSAVGGGYRPDPLVLAEIEGSSTSSSSFVALSASMSNMLGLFSSSDSGDHKPGGNSSVEVVAGDAERDSRHAPEAHTPLTVISSRTAASLPWEALLLQGQLFDVNVVRHLALVALCAQAYTPVASAASQYSPSRSKSPLPAGCTVGPQWLQQPSLVAMCKGCSATVFAVSRSAETERMQRAVGAKASIAALHHTTAHLHTNSSADDFSADMGQSQSNFPGLDTLPAAVLPSSVPLAIDDSHNILGNGAVISLAEAASLLPGPLSARSLWRHLTGPGPAGGRARRIPCNHFPLLLLGYSDYLQLADSVAHLLSSSRQAVLVFAPLFLLEPLAIELKLALDRWCKYNARASSLGHSDDKFDDPNDSASQVGSAAEVTGRGDKPTMARSKSLNTSGRSADSGDSRPHSGMFGKSSGPAKGGLASFLNRTAAALVPTRSSVARGRDAKSRTGGGSGSNGSSWHQSMPQIAEESLLEGQTGHSDAAAAARSAPASFRTSAYSRSSGSDRSLRAKSRSSNNMDLTGPSSPSSRRSQGSAAPTLQVDAHSPSRSLAGRDRTWPYHVIMSVVQEMQRDHDVPIVVFV